MSSVTYSVNFGRGDRTRKVIRPGKAKPTPDCPTAGRTPRVSKLMALAIEIDRMVRSGEAKDFAEVARMAGVTRARMSQILSMLNLAPDIQEQLLNLPQTKRGKDAVGEHHLRAVCGALDWEMQRRMVAARLPGLG